MSLQKFAKVCFHRCLSTRGRSLCNGMSVQGEVSVRGWVSVRESFHLYGKERAGGAHLYLPQRSCEGYVFTGVCLSTGGCLVRGGAWYRGGLVSQHVLRQNPPRERRPLLRTVRILLECILVV